PFVYNEDGAAPEQPVAPVHQHHHLHPSNSSSSPAQLLRQAAQQQQTPAPSGNGQHQQGQQHQLRHHLPPHLHQLQAQLLQSSPASQALSSNANGISTSYSAAAPIGASSGPSKRIQQLLTDPLLLPRKEPNREPQQIRSGTFSAAIAAGRTSPSALDKSPRRERRDRGEVSTADGSVLVQRSSLAQSVAIPIDARISNRASDQQTDGAGTVSRASCRGDVEGRCYSTRLQQQQEQQRKRNNSINQVLPFLVKVHAKTLLSVQELQERVASLEELSVSLQCAMESSSASLRGCSTTNPAHKQSSPWQTSGKGPVTSGSGTAVNYSQVVQVSKS
ncbi:hypothetical protein BIW11_11362, partial [Tropilaelaps mercedesae]